MQKIRRLDAHAAQIGQPDAATLAVQFLDAAEKAFDADEILFRMPPGVFDEERGVAAAEFHFQRLRFGKQFRQLERLDDGALLHDQIFLAFRLGFQIVNRQSQIKKMVGTVRFELTTSWTRTKRATKLRYVPTSRA